MSNIVSQFLSGKGQYINYNEADNYKLVFYKANYIVQSQELNNTQLILRDDINHIVANSIGSISILEGGVMSIKNNVVIVGSSLIYFQGYTISLTQVSFSNIINDIIGFQVNIEQITSVQDSQLLDQNPNSRNALQEGADRIKITGSWVLKSTLTDLTNFYSVFVIEDSDIVNNGNIEIFDKPEFLRKYDFSTNGNYVIEGFDISYIGTEKTNFVNNGGFLKWSNGLSFDISSNNISETADNWFVDSKLSEVQVSRSEFILTQTDVPNNPVYYLTLNALDSLSKPELFFKINDVRSLSFKPITVSFWMKASKSVNLNFYLRQDFGQGGSQDVIKNIGNQIVGTTWTQVSFEVLVPNVSGRVIGSDSYLAFHVYNGVSEVYSLNVSTGSVLNKYLDKGDFYKFLVREGIANVNGAEIVINNNSTLNVPIGSDIKTISGEPYPYVLNSTYNLKSPNARSISRILGQKQVTKTVTHGSFAGAMDQLPNTPVFSIISITQGATTYTQGVDYALNGDKVDWSIGGTEPAPSSSYSVTFIYMESNIAYSFNQDNGTFTIDEPLVTGSIFYVDYGVVIPRNDRVILNKYGKVFPIVGNSNFNNIFPYFSNDMGLHLADLELVYRQEPKIKLVYNRPYKLSDINYLYNSIKDIKNSLNDLELSNKSFNSLYTGNENRVEYVEAFNGNSSLIDDSNSSCDIYSNILTSKVTYSTQEIITDKNTLPFSDLSDFSNLDSYNNFIDVNVDNDITDEVAYFSLDKYDIKWYNENISKKIFFGDEQYVRDYQIFDKIPQDFSPAFTLNISGFRFGSSEALSIYIDNVLIKTIKSQPNGTFVDTITISSNTVKSGKRKIKVIGLNSNRYFSDFISLTSYNENSLINSYISLPSKDFVERKYATSNLDNQTTIYSNSNWNWRGNPIFQTFRYDTDLMIASIDLPIKSADSDILVYISECSNDVPDSNKVVSYGFILASDVIQNGVNRVTFKTPVFIEANKMYSFIITSTTSKFSLNYCDLLKDKSLKENIFLDAFISINNSALVRNSNFQLSLRINTYNFSPNSFDLSYISIERELGVLNAISITDLAVISSLKGFDSTSLTLKVILVDRGNETYNAEVFRNISFQSYTGRVRIVAIFTSYNFKLSTYIDPTVIVCLGTLQTSSYYQSKTFNFTGNRIVFTTTIIKDTNSSVVPYYFDGTTYVPLDPNPSNNVDLGDKVILYFFKDILNSISSTSIKINLNSINLAARPFISNFRFWFNIPFGGNNYVQFSPDGTLNMSNKKIVNVASGTGNTDATNVQQLNNLQTTITNQTNASLTNFQNSLNASLPGQIQTIVDSSITTVRQQIEDDYNGKINTISNTLNTRIDQEIASVLQTTNSQITQATTDINNSVNSQISQLSISLNATIDTKIQTSKNEIIAEVNADVDTVIQNSVATATQNLQATILSEVDNKLIINNATLSSQITSEVNQAVSDLTLLFNTNLTNEVNSLKNVFIPSAISQNNTTLFLNQLENGEYYADYDGDQNLTISILDPLNRNFIKNHIVLEGTNTTDHTIKLQDLTLLISQYSQFNFNVIFKIVNDSELRDLTIYDVNNSIFSVIKPLGFINVGFDTIDVEYFISTEGSVSVKSILDYTGNSFAGDVTIDKNFIGLGNVENIAPMDMPISTATQTALNNTISLAGYLPNNSDLNLLALNGPYGVYGVSIGAAQSFINGPIFSESGSMQAGVLENIKIFFGSIVSTTFYVMQTYTINFPFNRPLVVFKRFYHQNTQEWSTWETTGLQSLGNVANNVDLNTFTNIGFFHIQQVQWSGILNLPTTTSAVSQLHVYKVSTSATTPIIMQKLYVFGSSTAVWIRYYITASWSNWALTTPAPATTSSLGTVQLASGATTNTVYTKDQIDDMGLVSVQTGSNWQKFGNMLYQFGSYTFPTGYQFTVDQNASVVENTSTIFVNITYPLATFTQPPLTTISNLSYVLITGFSYPIPAFQYYEIINDNSFKLGIGLLIPSGTYTLSSPATITWQAFGLSS